MKNYSLLALMILTLVLPAHSQYEIGNDVFTYLQSDGVILSNNQVMRDAKVKKKFISDFLKENGEIQLYTKHFSIEVNTRMDYEIGEISVASGSFSIMFIKQKRDPSGAQIELLVVYKKDSPVDDLMNIDQRRKKWVTLCNAHEASELVKDLYTSKAYYYNRGRLIQGTQAISKEYSYMNSPSYSLDLTPKKVMFVNPNIAYEIGRCSGSYPLPYMLLWEKQSDGNWKILMDSNF